MPGSDAIAAVEWAMRFRVARQAALAANVANVDTPGYRRTDLAFREALDRAETGLARTQADHLGGSDAAAGAFRRVASSGARRPDGNGVDLDRELIELSRNAGAFNQQAEVLTRLIELRRTAISGGGR